MAIVALGVVIGQASLSPETAAAREPLGYPFSAGQTWKIVRGYNCLPSHCDTHWEDGSDGLSLDLLKTTGSTAGQRVLAVFTGQIVVERSAPGNFGCRAVLRGNDGREFLYVHIVPKNTSNCSGFPARVDKGDVLGKVWKPPARSGFPAHMHLQWCNGFWGGCSNVSARPLNEGVFRFPEGGPYRQGCGEWCGSTMRSTRSPDNTVRNRVPNRSFEAGAGDWPTGWYLYRGGCEGFQQWLSGTARTGRKAVTVELPTEDEMNRCPAVSISAWWSDLVRVDPSRTYTFSAWYRSIRTNDCVPLPGLHIVFFDRNGDPISHHGGVTDRNPTAGVWRQTSITVGPGINTDWGPDVAAVRLRLWGTGDFGHRPDCGLNVYHQTIQYDDVALTSR